MLKINRRTDYAVRVILALAKRPFGARLSTQEVQEEMQIPRPFLQRIIADLSKAELIETFPGPNGGLQLARASEEINLRHVWEAIDGELEISACLSSPQDCPFGPVCPVRCRWGRLQQVMLHELESATFSELAKEAAQATERPISINEFIVLHSPKGGSRAKVERGEI